MTPGTPWVALPGPGVRLAEADLPTLIAIWEGAVADLAAVAGSGSPADWTARTECPGWTVGDLVAHTVAIERFLLGEQDPQHEPDWAALPHATGDFGRWTEVPVDLRRTRTREEVLAELAAVTARRHAALLAGPQSPDAEVVGVTGRPTSLGRSLRMRIFDVWVHEQDARRAIGQPGHLASPGAWISAGQLFGALPYVWARGAQAPADAALRVTVTGPGVVARQTVVVTDAGLGIRVADTAVAVPTVALTLPWPDLVRLQCGRVAPDDPQVRSRLELAGDPDLCQRLLHGLVITP